MAAAAEEEKPILVHLASEKDEIGETFNVWYVLKHGGGGSPKLSKLYDDAPPQFKCFSPGSNSAMVGSCLYVITGQAWMQSPSRLHWIDTLKPEDGWKSSKDLPFYVKGGKLLVTGNLICVLPVNSKLICVLPELSETFTPIWAVSEEKQSIMPPGGLEARYVDLYNKKKKSWSRDFGHIRLPELMVPEPFISSSI